MPYSRCRCKIHYENKVFDLYRVTGYNILGGSVSRNVVLYLKHNKSRAAFNFVAEQMLDIIKTRAPYLFDITSRTVITYVPRSKRAKRKEGYDQSYEIAKIISEKSGKPLVKAFCNRSKSPQKTLNKEERMSNAELSYDTLPEAAECSGKSVIIIDDIVTTGASIGVCGTQLMNLGAVQVIGLVYAKTEDKRDK
jgi:predicted amidophosphoribosyltransferase